jgi:hypothetical protein
MRKYCSDEVSEFQYMEVFNESAFSDYTIHAGRAGGAADLFGGM